MLQALRCPEEFLLAVVTILSLLMGIPGAAITSPPPHPPGSAALWGGESVISRASPFDKILRVADEEPKDSPVKLKLGDREQFSALG